jgi:hypothetical protein
VNLYTGTILKHYLAQIRCRIGAEDFAFETVFYERGNISAVIHMRVRKQHYIDSLGVNEKTPVLLKGFFSFALKEPAIEQNIFAIDRYNVR